MSKQKNTSISQQQKHSKSYLKSKSSFKLALHSKQEISLRTGKKIKTVSQIMQNIKARRVQSYQKISFNIRKMDEIFKGTLKSPQFPSANPEKPRQQSKVKKQQKLKTCANFYQPLKIKKNIITNNHLIDNMEGHLRAKTEHIEQNNHQDSFYKQTSSFKKSSILPSATSILRSSRHQKPNLNIIPGVEFRQSPQDSPEQRSSMDRAKSFSTVLTKNGSNTYLHLNQLLLCDHDQRIECMYNIRKESRLQSPPKQWQFYNCLKLNNLSLYRTSLRISCQNWVLVDYLQLKYLRGSEPKQQKQIKVVLILLISNMLMQLQNVGLDCKKLKYRINNELVSRKLQRQQRKDKTFTLANNTIISVWDLFIGLLYTSKTDITWHFVYLLAYLHKKYNFYVEGAADNIQEYSSYVYISTNAQTKQFQKIFGILCKGITDRLKLSSFKFEYKHKKYIGMMKNKLLIGDYYNSSLLKQQNEVQYLLVKGNCIEASIIFMECMSYPHFHDLFTNPATSVPVKLQYQVGNKYWQWRQHEWIHRCGTSKSKDNFILMDTNAQNKNISSVCYNTQDYGIIILNDSKANMTPLDCESVLQWMRKTIKRFQINNH